MVILWRNDPLKAKWAMLAKAYSVLRGNKEKYEVPLSDFFDTCAPLVGVIPAEEYMTIMGWKVYKKDGVKEVSCSNQDRDNESWLTFSSNYRNQ